MALLSLRLILPDIPGPTEPEVVVRAALADAMEAARADAVAVSPVRTGRLVASWTTRPTRRGHVLVAEVPYGNFVTPGKGRPPLSRWPVRQRVALRIAESLERHAEDVAQAFAAGAFRR